MTKIEFPWVRRVLLVAVLVGALLGGGWYCYAWVLPGRAGPANSAEVSKASATAKAELDRRLAEVLAALPGRPELLGDAAWDRCLWGGDVESDTVSSMNCQRLHARYVVFDGDPAEVAGSWYTALGARNWSGARTRSGQPYEWYYYVDPVTKDYLRITVVSESDLLLTLDDEAYREGIITYELSRQRFGAQDAAERAVAAGRRVAELSLVRTYYAEGAAYLQPPN